MGRNFRKCHYDGLFIAAIDNQKYLGILIELNFGLIE